jgi:hypothetical protein
VATFDADPGRLSAAFAWERLPAPPVIVATTLEAARRLLGDDTLRWDSGRTVLLDVGLRHRRGDLFVISDLDEAGWTERFTAADPTLAPPGHSLVQAQMPLRPGEGAPRGCGAWSACWTCPAGPGATGRRWTAAMGCSWPAT